MTTSMSLSRGQGWNKNKDLKVIEERILKQLKIELNKKNQFDLPR